VRSNEQAMAEHIADGSTVPVIAARTDKFSILPVLADMMTIQEHFDRLEGLEIGWVGPPRAMFNTYLAIAPRLGLNLKYHCCVPNVRTGIRATLTAITTSRLCLVAQLSLGH